MYKVDDGALPRVDTCSPLPPAPSLPSSAGAHSRDGDAAAEHPGQPGPPERRGRAHVVQGLGRVPQGAPALRVRARACVVGGQVNGNGKAPSELGPDSRRLAECHA